MAAYGTYIGTASVFRETAGSDRWADKKKHSRSVKGEGDCIEENFTKRGACDVLSLASVSFGLQGIFAGWPGNGTEDLE